MAKGRGTGRLVLHPQADAAPHHRRVDGAAVARRQAHQSENRHRTLPFACGCARNFQPRLRASHPERRSIKIAGDSRPGTVGDLFDAYVPHLRKEGKPSWPVMPRRASTKLPTLSGATGPLARSCPRMCSAFFARSMIAATLRWPTTCAAMSAPRSHGRSNRSTTTAIHRRAASSCTRTPRPAFRLSRRSQATVGLTKTNSCSCIAGSNVPTRRCIRPTRVRSAS